MREASVPLVAPMLLVGAGTVVALAALRGRNAAPDATGSSTEGASGASASSGTSSASSGASGASASSTVRDIWVWPLPRWQGYAPEISDGYDSWRTNTKGERIKHRGVDIMYRRRSRADQRDSYPPNTPHGDANYFMPDSIPVLACRDAQVWSAGKTPRGFAVVLDHGPPWATFYQHMSTIFVQETQRARSGQRVRAGDVIGYVGGDPLESSHIMHLHFEAWYRGAHEAAIDPATMMKTWLIAPLAEPESLVASV